MKAPVQIKGMTPEVETHPRIIIHEVEISRLEDDGGPVIRGTAAHLVHEKNCLLPVTSMCTCTPHWEHD